MENLVALFKAQLALWATMSPIAVFFSIIVMLVLFLGMCNIIYHGILVAIGKEECSFF